MFYLLIPGLKLTLWSGCDSNARPPVYQTGAAKPSELPDHYVCRPGGIRTHSVSLYMLLRHACLASCATDPFWRSILIYRLQSATHGSILQISCQTCSPGGIRTLKISLLRRTRFPVTSPGHYIISHSIVSTF